MVTQQGPRQSAQNSPRNEQRQGQQPQGPQDSQPQQQPGSPMRSWLNWILLAALIAWNVLLFWPQGQPASTAIPYSTFLSQVQAGNVRQVSVQGADIKGSFVQPVPAAVLSGTPTSATPAATVAQGTPG